MRRNITWETETDLIIIYYNSEYIYCYGKPKDHFRDAAEMVKES